MGGIVATSRWRIRSRRSGDWTHRAIVIESEPGSELAPGTYPPGRLDANGGLPVVADVPRPYWELDAVRLDPSEELLGRPIARADALEPIPLFDEDGSFDVTWLPRGDRWSFVSAYRDHGARVLVRHELSRIGP